MKLQIPQVIPFRAPGSQSYIAQVVPTAPLTHSWWLSPTPTHQVAHPSQFHPKEKFPRYVKVVSTPSPNSRVAHPLCLIAKGGLFALHANNHVYLLGGSASAAGSNSLASLHPLYLQKQA
jgi:hypothetical protein